MNRNQDKPDPKAESHHIYTPKVFSKNSKEANMAKEEQEAWWQEYQILQDKIPTSSCPD